MNDPFVSLTEEVVRLRRCLNDLVGFTAVSDATTSSEPSEILGLVLDALLRRLRPAFLLVRLIDPEGALFPACFARSSASEPTFPESDPRLRKIEADMIGNPDPENVYLFAASMAYCGQKDAAMRMLKSAVAHKYCAYQALQQDSLLAPLRNLPEWPALLESAKQCHETFLSERNQPQH